MEGSKLIAERVARLQADGSPAVVTGDFNCNPGSAAHRVFAARGFTDCFLAAGNRDGADSPYHGFEGAGYDASRWGVPFWRIDWVLARDGARRVETTACAIVRDAEPLAYPSDHYPVVAELRLAE